VKDLVSPRISAIAPYQPGKPIEELHRELGASWPKEGAIKLASNENPLGPSPKAVQAARAALEEAHLYPDGASFQLTAKLASMLKVQPAQIVCGSGSNELIDLLVQTYCDTDEEVLAPAVSFSCYRLSAEAHRRPFRESPNGPGFAYQLDALVDAVGPSTKLVFLANPNNPTGVYANQKEFSRFFERLPDDVLLVVDEAYLEYVRASDYPDALDHLPKRERMVTLRTFSKIYGLASLRVGYLVGHAQVVQYLHRTRMAFNVSSIGQAAARAALDDVEHVQRSRELNAAELPKLETRLRALGLGVTPSQTNFVLVDLGRAAQPIYQALLHRGVIVRPLLPYGLPNHLRITVGTPTQNERLLAALAEVL